MKNYFIPKESYSRISDISILYLKEDMHIKGLIFDVDGTLKRHNIIPDETLSFIKKAKSDGLKISILTNNPLLSSSLVKTLDIPIYKKFACKPFKKPFLKMAEKMKLRPYEIAVIGNSKISDIFGANRAGMYSIYIQDLHGYRVKIRNKGNLKNFGIKPINNEDEKENYKK